MILSYTFCGKTYSCNKGGINHGLKDIFSIIIDIDFNYLDYIYNSNY